MFLTSSGKSIEKGPISLLEAGNSRVWEWLVGKKTTFAEIPVGLHSDNWLMQKGTFQPSQDLSRLIQVEAALQILWTKAIVYLRDYSNILGTTLKEFGSQ